MREIRMSGSEGGAAQINASFLPLSDGVTHTACVVFRRVRSPGPSRAEGRQGKSQVVHPWPYGDPCVIGGVSVPGAGAGTAPRY